MNFTIQETIFCKAAICWAVGEALSVEEIQVEPPKKGEVRVKVLSSSVCHTDIAAWNGIVPAKYPCILGHEGAGVVESVGDSVSSISVGDNVLILCLGQCYECTACKNPDTNNCLKYGVGSSEMLDGTTRFRTKGHSLYHFFGTSVFSEYTVVDEARCGKINHRAKMDEACLFACCFPTGYGSVVNIASIKPGQTVGVWGLGSVGLAAVYAAVKNRAAVVIGIDCNESKRDHGFKFGCHHFVNPLKCKEENKTTEEVIKSLTDGLGLDIAIDCAGGSNVVVEAINCTAHWGSTVIVGVAGDPRKLDISPNVFLSGRQLKGGLLGGYKTREQIPILVDEHVEGKIEIKDFITGKVKLEEINCAFDWLIEGKALRTVILF